MRRIAEHRRIAVVGAGVSGLVAAAELHRAGHDVHVFEAGDYPGGHTNTIDVETPGGPLAVDTGFIVFNELNYPNFERMLAELGVASQPTDMSFSVSDGRGGFEWATTGPRGAVRAPGARARPALSPHAARPGPLQPRGPQARRQRRARARRSVASSPTAATRTTSSSGCSSPRPRPSGPRTPRRCGASRRASSPSSSTTIGVLQLRNRPSWRSITGGSRRYVEALIAPFLDRVNLCAPVRRVHRLPDGVVDRAR